MITGVSLAMREQLVCAYYCYKEWVEGAEQLRKRTCPERKTKTYYVFNGQEK